MPHLLKALLCSSKFSFQMCFGIGQRSTKADPPMLQIRVGIYKQTPFILSTAILRHIPGGDPSADPPALGTALTLLCLEAAEYLFRARSWEVQRSAQWGVNCSSRVAGRRSRVSSTLHSHTPQLSCPQGCRHRVNSPEPEQCWSCRTVLALAFLMDP